MTNFWVGFAASLAATIALGVAKAALRLKVPGAFLPVRYHLMRMASALPWTGHLCGQWFFEWQVSGSKNFPNVNTSSVSLSHAFGRVAGRFVTRGVTYYIDCRVEGGFVTGEWRALGQHTYFGALQLRLLPMGNEMRGTWLGFDSRGNVKSGPSTLRKA